MPHFSPRCGSVEERTCTRAIEPRFKSAARARHLPTFNCKLTPPARRTPTKRNSLMRLARFRDAAKALFPATEAESRVLPPDPRGPGRPNCLLPVTLTGVRQLRSRKVRADRRWPGECFPRRSRRGNKRHRRRPLEQCARLRRHCQRRDLGDHKRRCRRP